MASNTHTCPQCQSETLKRAAAGIWQCTKCGAKRAGGAFEPETGAEQMMRRAMSDEDEPEELAAAQEELED